MTTNRFPPLDPAAIEDTRQSLHAYARVLGHYLKRCRARRKHWWHASLRPSLNGLTTGVVYTTGCDFELELNLRASLFCARTQAGQSLDIELEGQSATQLTAKLTGFLADNGIEQSLLANAAGQDDSDAHYPAYSRRQATNMAKALSGVAAAMTSLRAGFREQSSPIQVWPHHFDLSMLWLPGTRIPGQDPVDEEASDKQVNFGFTFGDDAVREPYFYITAYPLPEHLHRLSLPDGASWRTAGFNGVFLSYQQLLTTSNPMGYLLSLWDQVLSAARKQMTD